MKLTFILFTLFINFFHPFFINAEERIDASNNQIDNSLKEESNINKIHIVQVGDTISSISKFYSIEKELIIKLNDLKNENFIYVGQNLKIFDNKQNAITQKSKENEDKNKSHVVQEGETITEISTKYGLNAKYLIEINNLKNPDSIEVGSIIFLKKNNYLNKETTSKKKGEENNQFITIDKKTYGPITTQNNKLEEVGGRKILNALNQSDKELIISINCETKNLDVKIPGREWSGWVPAKEEFEKNLINDFC